MTNHRLAAFLLMTLVVAWAMPAAAQLGPGPFAVFPTGDETDGRFLGFGCPGLATFEEGVSITISVPPDESSFTLNVFDGEGGLADLAGNKHWDQGVGELVYRIYFDPLNAGNTAPADLVGEWKGNSVNATGGPLWSASSATMPDNEWWAVTVDTTPAAESPAGPFLYHLTIDFPPAPDDPCDVGSGLVESNIKLAASSPLSFRVPRFGFVAAFRQFFNDGPILYPGESFPPADFTAAAATSTYDGTFSFRINLQEAATDLRLYGGDFDHGTDGLDSAPSGRQLIPCVDSDDPDTLNDYSNLPAILQAGLPAGAMEGAAGKGAPPDDNAFDAFRRGELDDPDEVGCVRWTITDPTGNVYRNDNPSGDREWEQFRIVSQLDPDADDTTKADVTATTDLLPTGVWTVEVFGLDLSNLNFWYVEADVCAERELQDPLPDITFDVGADGGLLPAGTLVAEQWASQGAHFASADPAHPLMIFDSASPTGEDPDLGTPHTDFGGPGVGAGGGSGQPGENKVARGKVLILSEDGNSSDPDDDAGGGTMVVTFDRPVNVAAVELLDIEEAGGSIDAYDAGGGLLATIAIPPLGDNSFQSVAVGITGVSRLEINLVGSGAVPAIRFDREVETEAACPPPTFLVGDTVWRDLNENGVQDPGEPGIPGVLVNLFRDPLQPPIKQVVTGDTSSPDFALCQLNNTGLDEDGLYCFGVNTAGSYTVEIDPSNFAPGGPLAGLFSTTVGGETQTKSVSDDNVLTYDFGYNGAALGDRVWRDTDGDGIQEPGEPGINGVTVELRDAGGNVIATAVTAGDGNYLFTGLASGVYTVTVVPSTLPPGLAQTFDLDGLGTPDRATAPLAPAEIRLDYDFGYTPCGECDGKVSELTLRYDGDEPAHVRVVQDDGEIVFDTNPQGSFDCSKPIHALTMIWDGTQSVRIKAWKGNVGSTLLADIDNIAPGTEVTVSGFAGSPNDVFWEVFAAGTSSKLGESKFHLSCSDDDMDGAEDCGKREGNAKDNSSTSLLNDWLFEGMVDSDEILDCTQPGPDTRLQPGDVISFESIGDDFGSNTEIFVDGLLHTEIHTSCSKPIGPGLTSGDFTVVAGGSRDGGALCPLATCAPQGEGLLEFKDRDVKWRLANAGDLDLVITRVVLVWPAANGALDELKLDGDKFFDGLGPAPTADLETADFEGSLGKRTIKAGDDRVFKMKFVNNALATGDYEIRIEFGAGCAIEFGQTGLPTGTFDCSKPIDQLTMIWDGSQAVRVKAWKGSVGSTLLADVDNVTVASELAVSGFAGSPNDVFWELFAAGTSTKLGESKFHLSCSDDGMDGAEDCGTRQGDGKGNDASLINDWLLEGMVDSDETLDCTP